MTSRSKSQQEKGTGTGAVNTSTALSLHIPLSCGTWFPPLQLTTTSVSSPALGWPMEWGAGIALQGQLLHAGAQAHSRASSPEQSLPARVSTWGVQAQEQADALTPHKWTDAARGTSLPRMRGKEQNLPLALQDGPRTGLREQPAPGFAAGDRKPAPSSEGDVASLRLCQAPGAPSDNAEPRGAGALCLPPLGRNPPREI